jgi:hypothetical protein
VAQQLRIEIKGKDEFWGRAFRVEWEHQFPDRKLTPDVSGRYLARREWLEDLEGVARQTFCQVLCAPENPRRREWISSLIPRGLS